MGLVQSPKVVTDGLVFYYDQNNIKSYQGPPIQNLASTIVPNGSVGTGISIVGGYENVNIPQIGAANAAFNTIQNNYTSFSPNSADCCPAPFAYTGGFGSGGFAVSPSTLYTYGIVYKVNSGYTHPNYMYRYEYTANGGTYVTEGGVHSDSNRISLGDGWFWAWGTFTTQATTNWIAWAAAFYYRYSNTTDKLSIAKVLITPGNYTGLHPRYWPNVNTTRSSTQTLLDLTRRNSVTANNMAYASSGAFSFNGSTSHLVTSRIPGTGSSTGSVTWCVWTKPDGSAGNIMSMAQDNPQGGWNMPPIAASSSQFRGKIWNNTALTSSTYTIGSWYYVCLVFNYNATLANAYQRLYVNGEQVAEQTSITYSSSGVDNFLFFGQANPGADNTGNYSGSTDVAQVYNRALSPAEIRQNFNALRGRFGI